MAWTVDGNSYEYRKKITVQDGNIDSDLSDFPVLINIEADTDIGGKTNTDGHDIRFTDNDGSTLLKYERITHTVSGSPDQLDAKYWVKVPNLYASPTGSQNEIYIYYRSADTTDGEDATNVWDSDFGAVLHMAGAAYTDIDDVANSNDISGEYGSPAYNQTGVINKAVYFDGTSGDEIYAPDNATIDATTAITISCWLKKTDNTDRGVLLYKYWDGAGRAWFISSEGDEIALAMGNSSGGATGTYFFISTTDFNLANDTWYHISVRWSASGGTAYILKNGVASSVTGSKDDNLYNNTASLRIGDKYDSESSTDNTKLEGYVEEVRITKDKDRGTAWLNFEYHNIAEADNELTFGAEKASLEASFSALAIQATIPAITATVEFVGFFTPLGLQVTTPTMSPSWIYEASATLSPLSIQITNPATTATNTSVWTASFSSLSLQINFPSIIAYDWQHDPKNTASWDYDTKNTANYEYETKNNGSWEFQDKYQ